MGLKDINVFIIESIHHLPSSYVIRDQQSVGNTKELYNALEKFEDNDAFIMPIVTDKFEYKGVDQVIPLQPEQIFIMDTLRNENIRNMDVLDIGLGSGVLSIFCLKNGAKSCTALEINHRAKNYAGFNAVVNGVEDRLRIVDGDVLSIFSPVTDHQYDLIISNPPFEPTPPSLDYYLNSSAGIYGIDFLKGIFEHADDHLNDKGVLQIVTMAPGNMETPFLLTRMLGEYLPERDISITLDLLPIAYDNFLERFANDFSTEPEEIELMKTMAKEDGVTHLHMLVLRYQKGYKGHIKYTKSAKLYEEWKTPLGSKESNQAAVTASNTGALA